MLLLHSDSVSEQFLNGTSAHYRLFSATNGGWEENKNIGIKSDIESDLTANNYKILCASPSVLPSVL